MQKIEQNDRMVKTRDFFKKIGAIKGSFHARMGAIKDRNSKGLTEEVARIHRRSIYKRF